MYLAVSEESISAALMAEIGKRQVPVYFVNRTMQGAELEYPELEKLILALVYAARRLRRYFQAHPIQVLSDKPIKQILARPEKSRRIAKWAIELGHEIEFKGRNLVKGQILADFLVANQVKGLFEARQPVIKQYLEKAKELLASFPSYSIEHIKRDQNKKADALSKLASMIFSKLAKEVLVEVVQENSITQREVADVTNEERDSWMLPIQEYLQLGKLPDDPQKARKLRIKAPLYKIMDGTLYQKSYLSPRLRCVGGIDIVGPLPMAPGGVRFLVVDIEYFTKTTPKSSNEETPFSLVYGSEAVIPIEISIETRRIQNLDPKKNVKRCREYLDILEEGREIASIKESHYKQKLKG
ncbi:reverse transcriptase domain-containing protein [Tanacetum coccineum]